MDAARPASSPPREPGRPPKLDHERIADAVLHVGFAGLTVEAVAAALDVGTAMLYRYVASRGELLALAWDRVLVRTDWPGGDAPWDELLADYATILWRLSADHPGAISELATGPVPPAMMRLYDDPAVALVRGGFTPANAVLAVDSVIDLTIDHRLGVERLDLATAGELGLRHELAVSWPRHNSDDDHVDDRAKVRAAMVDAIQDDPKL